MRRTLSIIALAVSLVAALVAVAAGPAGAQPAPPTSLSGDGRTVTAGATSLTVSQASGLAPGGVTLTVSGSGYDESKGVYVSLCAVPPAGHPPSPCGGGEDRTGTSGASAWVSSNPPAYASGLTVPYGPGGTFTVQISVTSAIAPGLDCTVVRCAVVTRNDHTRGSDRSQDLFIPVAFGSGPPPAAPPTAAPTAPAEPVAPPTTVLDLSMFPPPTQLAADGLSVSDGVRTLVASSVSDLDPESVEVEVTGEGFDPAAGVYVALCRTHTDGTAPGPCTSGAGAAWLSSSPPDYGADLAEPFDEGGRFAVVLQVGAIIDASTDCREVTCAVMTRADDTAPAVRSHDLAIPVTFAAESTPATTTTEPVTEVVDDEQAVAAVAVPADDGGSPAVWLLVVAVLAVVGVGVAVVVRRRGASPTPGSP